MRVLYLSRADEFRDKSSLVIIAKSVIRYMLESDPEMFVTWVIPRGTKPEILDEYVLAPLGENARRLEFLPVMAGLSGRTLGYFFNEDLWYALTQTKVKTPYDVVLSNQMALTPLYSFLLTNRYQSSRYNVDVPIVNWQMWTATTQQLKEVPEYYAGEADVVAESLSSMFGTNVWESEVLKKAHLDTIKQYVQPSVVRKVEEQSVVIANGVDWPNLDRVWEARGRRAYAVEVGDGSIASGSGPNLFWGGRLANQKKPRVTFPLMARVQTLTGCEVVVSTNRPESDPDVTWARNAFPSWSLHAGIDRTGFFGLMAQGDVFMCDSPSESYGVAWLEMLATGMLGVFAPAWWNETLLPDWYPFRSADPETRVQMAAALLKQWPDGPLWTKYVPKVREWIRTEHNEAECGRRLGELLRGTKAVSLYADRHKGTGSVGQLAVQAANELWPPDGEKALPEQAIWDRMTTLSESSREWGKPGDLVSRMYLRRCLETAGWKDVSDGPDVKFVKEA
jgi:hypothetical protein